MRRMLSIILCLSFLSCAGPRNPYSNQEITVNELKYHVGFLASDSLQGRGSGTEGNNIAAEYLEKEIQSYGLKPAGVGGTYFQPFDVVTGLEAGTTTALRVADHSFEVNKDYRPLGMAADTSAQSDVVLIGYGISAPDLKYDDYADADVNGKIVAVLRYSPDGDNPHSKFYDYAPIRRKVGLAAEKGAAGVLIVTGPVDGDDELMKLESDMARSDYGIPAASVLRQAVCEILGIQEDALKRYQETLNRTKKPESIYGNNKTFLQTEVIVNKARTQNVLGLLPGTDPKLRDEIVVIGAHFDHLGMGGANSLYIGPPAIHNGADDNASGTSAILELAQKLSKSPLKRSVLFAGFSGEEMGLLGSKYFVEHPTVDTSKIAVMFNFDMVGRLTDSNLIVHGSGTSPDFKSMMEELNRDYHFNLTLKEDGNGPSDFASFYQIDKPVLAFFTNLHSDYHRPSDDADKINYEGEREVVNYAYEAIVRVGNAEVRPAFVKVASSADRPMRGFRATLGIIPSYADNSEGLKIDGVSPGKAADMAGMKKGDLIVRFGGKVIKNVYDYTYALGEYKAGDKVEVTVIRDGKEVKLEAILQKSSRP